MAEWDVTITTRVYRAYLVQAESAHDAIAQVSRLWDDAQIAEPTFGYDAWEITTPGCSGMPQRLAAWEAEVPDAVALT